MGTIATLILAWSLVQIHGELFPQTRSSRHSELEEVSATCRDNYNYKSPHPCTPGVNCAFVVTWQPLEEEEGVEFHVMASLAGLNHTSSLWVALGFSSNSDMGDTDVTACWHHAKSDGYDIRKGYNTPGNHNFVLSAEDSSSQQQQPVDLLSNGTGIKDGVFSCKFRRLVDTSNTPSKKQFVLAAIGSLVEEEGEGNIRMLEHSAHTVSTCACDVMACDVACSCPVGFFYQMLKLHGIVMMVSFMLLIPAGAILSRYYKSVFLNVWFKAHVTTVVIGVLWSLVGLGLVLTHTRGVFSVGLHQILGILVLFLGVLQPTVGFLRPLNKPTKLRRLFNIFHKSMAGSIFVLSVVVLFCGVYLFHNGVFIFMFVVMALYVLFNLSFVVLLEVLKRNQKFSSSPPVGYHKVTTRRDDTESEEEAVYVKDEPSKSAKGPTHSLEKSLLLLFVVVNLILTGLNSTFIFYYDAEED